jgi:hypothetical protein
MNKKLDTSHLTSNGVRYDHSKMVENYDYSNIKDADKKLIEEICSILIDRTGLPTTVIVNELKTRFGLEEQIYYKKEDTLWYKLTKDFLKDAVYIHQGFKNLQIEDEKKKKILRVPHYAISLDMDVWDNLAKHIEKNVIKKFLEDLKNVKK